MLRRRRRRRVVYHVSDVAAMASCGVAIAWSFLLTREPMAACCGCMLILLLGAVWRMPSEDDVYKVLLVDADDAEYYGDDDDHHHHNDDDDTDSLGSDMTVDLMSEDDFYWVMQELKERTTCVG